jgi:hypothetical protein
MIAGDYGNSTFVFPATYNMPFDDTTYTYRDFTGALTVTLISNAPTEGGAWPASVPRRQTFPCVIINNARVSYTPRTPNDFPTNGQYTCQLMLTFASGGPVRSNPFCITILPAE